ncbi:MAG: oligosaccharide flippase family protein [Nanoarchaeota archaeon]
MDQKKIVRQIEFSYIIILLGMIIAPFLPFVLTRTLSLQEYGVYSLYYSFTQLFVVLLEFALSQYIITKLPAERQGERIKDFLSSVLINIVLFFFFVIIAFLPYLRNWFLHINKLESYPDLYYYCIVIIFFGVILRLLYAYYFAKKEISYANIIDFLKNNVWIILIILFFLVRKSLTIRQVFLLWAVSFLVTAFFLILRFSAELKGGMLKALVSLKRAKKALFFSLPLIPALVSTWAISLSDRYIINYFENPSRVALYSLPYSILGVILTLGATITTVLYPYFVEQAKKKQHDKDDLLQNISLKYGLIIILPAIFGFLLLRKEIITLISGSAYLASAEVVPYLFLFPLFAFIGFVIYQHVLSQHKTKEIGIIYSLGAILNIGLNIILIPKLSLQGAALSTLASYLFMATGLLLLTKKKIKLMPAYLKIERILLSTGIMILCLLFVHPATYYMKILTIILVAIIYFASLFLTKVFIKEEITIIKNILFKNKIIGLVRK